MDTIVFRYVLTVAESGSISAASRRLFMSQPALTKQIRKLETELGFQLFERSNSPLTVTPTGELFLEFASRYLDIEKEFLAKLQASSNIEKEHVLVGTTNRGGSYAGDHTAAFLESHPEIQLEYLDMSAQACEEALESGTVDLVIYTDPVLSDKIEYMPLEEDSLILVIPKESPVLEGLEVNGNSLDSPVEIGPERLRCPGVRFLLSTTAHSLYYAECEFLKKYKINPANTLRVDYVDTRYSIAVGGGGIVLIPKMTIKKEAYHDKVVFCTVKGEALYRYVVIAKKKGVKLSKGAECFWRFMVERKFRP